MILRAQKNVEVEQETKMNLIIWQIAFINLQDCV